MFMHQLRVEQLVFWRNRSNVFFTFLFPLLLLVVFANIGNADDRRFLVPGIAALAIVATCFQGMSIGLAMHRDQGVLKRIIATPLPLGMLVAAKVVSMGLVAIGEVLLVMLAGAWAYDVGWPADPVTFILTLVVGVLAFSAMGIALVAVIPNGDSAPAIANGVYLPMMFISGVFYDVDKFPTVIEKLAKVLPLYYLSTPMRAAWLGAGSQHLMRDLSILAGWGIATGVYAARRMRWVPVHER